MGEILKSVLISDERVSLGLTTPPKENLHVNPTIKETPLPSFSQQDIDNAYLNGIMHAETTMKSQIQALTSLLKGIPETLHAHRQQLSHEIADIVWMITQQFFIHQHHQKDAIANQVTQTLTQLNQKTNIELILHPHDVYLLQAEEVKIDFKAFKGIRIIADESLQLGGCIIRSEHGVFDASIERQIDNLKRVLVKMKSEATQSSSSTSSRTGSQ